MTKAEARRRLGKGKLVIFKWPNKNPLPDFFKYIFVYQEHQEGITYNNHKYRNQDGFFIKEALLKGWIPLSEKEYTLDLL